MGLEWELVENAQCDSLSQHERDILLCLRDPLTCPHGRLDRFELALCIDMPIEDVDRLVAGLKRKGMITCGH